MIPSFLVLHEDNNHNNNSNNNNNNNNNIMKHTKSNALARSSCEPTFAYTDLMYFSIDFSQTQLICNLPPIITILLAAHKTFLKTPMSGGALWCFGVLRGRPRAR
jgi:hypothetical protein